MSITVLVPAPVVSFVDEFHFPVLPNGLVGTSVPDERNMYMQRFQHNTTTGRQNNNLGNFGGTPGDFRFFDQVDGRVCFNCFSTNVALPVGTSFRNPIYHPYFNSGDVQPGAGNDEYNRVMQLRIGVNTGTTGAGVYSSDAQGFGIIVNAQNPNFTSTGIPTVGAAGQCRVIAAITGLNDGGAQRYRYRSYDEDSTVLETVNTTAAQIPTADAWNIFDFEVVGAANARPATIAVEVNGVPFVTPREMGSAELQTPDQNLAANFGIGWGFYDDNGAVTQPVNYWFRARWGVYDLAGVEVRE